MEVLLTRYRNLTVLLVVVVAQLLYLAYQVKTARDERLIRVWAVSAVTPMAGVVDGIRRNTIGFLQDYFILLDVRDQNRKLKTDNDHLRMENVYYRNQLSTAEHARALTLFQRQTPSKTVPARVIGNSTVATAKAVFIDRGSTSGIEKSMAVVTPEGIVGKVIAVYPLVSQVLLVTDATFKVGVESQKGHIHGVLNCGTGRCGVEQIQDGDQVGVGEWFFTSGEDRIFPKGFPVGTVVSVALGQGMKDVKLNLSGAPGGAEEVLVVLEGVHQPIPLGTAVDTSIAKSLPPPPGEKSSEGAEPGNRQTEADKLVRRYQQLGKDQGHVFGALASGLPNFNAKPNTPATSVDKGKSPGNAAPVATLAPAKPDLNNPGVIRPGVIKPAITKPSPARPVLPLGSPRPKTKAGPDDAAPPQ
jgi:rod shape-determining protein MreC